MEFLLLCLQFFHISTKYNFNLWRFMLPFTLPAFSVGWRNVKVCLGVTSTKMKRALAFPLFQQQRTVYRLTLVKAWNVDELQAYAELVSLGSPDFIEVKVSPCWPLLCTFLWCFVDHPRVKKSLNFYRRSQLFYLFTQEPGTLLVIGNSSSKDQAFVLTKLIIFRWEVDSQHKPND